MIINLRPKFMLLCVFALSSVLRSQQNIIEDNKAIIENSCDEEVADNLSVSPDAINADNLAENDLEPEQEVIIEQDQGPRIINKIVIKRVNENSFMSEDAIVTAIPYREGEPFKPNKTNQLINNIYRIGEPFSYFEQIEVLGEDLEDGKMNLHIITTEKPEVAGITIEGNKSLTLKDLEKVIQISDVHAINNADLESLAKIIKRLYQDKNYHNPEITWEFKKIDSDVKPTVIITIKEGYKSMVKRVNFVGNKNISHKQLKNIIFTREDWLGGFLTKAGSLQQDFLERDKHILENYYKTNGYMNARVTGVDVQVDDTNNFTVTFSIYEGDIYTIGDVEITGDESINHDNLKLILPVKAGEQYSAEKIRQSIELVKDLWADLGYLYVDVDPSVIPNEDKKSVKLSINVEPGKKVFVNRINIKGNVKTREKVIRRNLSVKEGDYVRQSQLERSKNKVANLSYFDERSGVNWKINRIDEETADLDLILSEVKTGKALINLGYGGSPLDLGSPSSTINVGGSIIESNLFGRGIRLNTSVNWSKQQTTFSINLADPWFLDRPIYSEVDFHLARSDYNQELQNVNDFKENRIGGFLGFGVVASYKPFILDTMVRLRTSVDNITYSNPPRAGEIKTPEQAVKQLFLNYSFQPGALSLLELFVARDYRNHTAHPTTGYQFSLNSRLGFGFNTSSGPYGSQEFYDYNGERLCVPIGCTKEKFGYYKTELDYTYYTPLLQDNSLIFMFHLFGGYVKRFTDRAVPYADLFHIGGPASVRGYNYGQISPFFLGDSLGASKAFFVNVELIFPIVADFSVKGCIFYDGGAGWGTPYLDIVKCYDAENGTDTMKFLTNNCFDYRHSIGLGVRMIRPQPIRIDYGFKLDRRKGESVSELHFSSYREF